ncbi:MAG: RNA methyltransferase [Cyanobacteria bacterium REEB446]|nr:RNA methyltransferase [Cyanobacteria bacterium REEB446]
MKLRMPTPERLEKITNTCKQRRKGIIVLEDIHDKHNIEAVFRSCDAFGIQMLYIIFDKERPFDPRLVGKNSSSSANKWIDFKIFSKTEDAYAELKSQGYKIYATALTDEAESIYETNFIAQDKVAIALGNENRGLSKFAIDQADSCIIIRMLGMLQSLNLSVTASICMFELNRQRLVSGALENFLLADEDCDSLVQDFLNR